MKAAKATSGWRKSQYGFKSHHQGACPFNSLLSRTEKPFFIYITTFLNIIYHRLSVYYFIFISVIESS